MRSPLPLVLMVTTALPNSSPVLFRTESETSQGTAQVWLDTQLRWQGDLPEPKGWYQASQLLTDQQCRQALEAADLHVSILLRDINQVFSDTSDPISQRWRDAAQRLRDLDLGLIDYYLDAADLFDDKSLALMPAFFQEPRFELAGGLRQFELRIDRTGGNETLIWFQLTDSDQGWADVSGYWQTAKLVELIDYANVAETAQILNRHLNAIAELGTEIRYVINKLRSGVAISRKERERYAGYALSIVELQRQFGEIT